MIMIEPSHFHMIDIGKKISTHRLAVANGKIFVGEKAFALIKNHQLPKGDPFILAEIAGIQGAKKTADLIPLCHPLPLEKIDIKLDLDEENNAIIATAFVSTTSKTGVEMEAISAVNVALLTIYDLTKMVEPHLIISDIQLLLKKGGKSGLWLSPDGVPPWIMQKIKIDVTPSLLGVQSAVITLSDRASSGVYEDKSGAYICKTLKSLGSSVTAYHVLPDDQKQLQNKIFAIIEEFKPAFIITTGGTGIGKRDITPDAILAIADKTLPGIGELLRAYGSQFTAHSWISRSLAAVVKDTLIICLPGSEKAVKEGLSCICPIIQHLIMMLNGNDHD